MKNSFLLLILLIALSSLHAGDDRPIFISDDLLLTPLAENVWIHTSYVTLPEWGKVSANGLAVLSGSRLYMVDTPWNDGQTRSLVEWFQEKGGIKEVHVTACHYHDDNLGGLGWVHRMGYDSYAIETTREICREKGLPVPKTPLGLHHRFDSEDIPLEIHFIGEGHTRDSVCAYLPGQKILFGGCSVKPMGSRSLGNIAEANLTEWPGTIEKMKGAFPEAQIVVPGHGAVGDLSLLDHTLSLLID